MSLDLTDLDLVSTVRDIIGDLNSGEIVIIDAVPDDTQKNYNPYDTSNEIAKPTLIGVYPFISYKDGTTKYNEALGVREGGYFKVKTGMPEQGGMHIKAKHYCYVNFSREAKVTVGVVDEVRTSISSIFDIRCKATETPPYTWEQIKDFFFEPVPLPSLGLKLKVPSIQAQEKLMDVAVVNVPRLSGEVGNG